LTRGVGEASRRPPGIRTLGTIVLALAALVVAGALVAPRADAQHKAKEGVVKSVDAASGAVTLEGGETVKTDAATKVTRDGKPAKIADLQPGDRVKYYADGDKPAAYLHAMHGG
jgi:hypothetical protein